MKYGPYYMEHSYADNFFEMLGPDGNVECLMFSHQHLKLVTNIHCLRHTSQTFI